VRDPIADAIGVLKLFKGAVLLGVAAAAFGFLDPTRHHALDGWLAALHPHARVLRIAIERLEHLGQHDLIVAGVLTLTYAALMSTEGVALLSQRHWAHAFTIFVTGSFIPLEIYELVQRPHGPRAAVLAVNVAIVVYLAVRLRQRQRRERAAVSGASARSYPSMRLHPRP
jgi:uncharacterized membrane protein (DUF2068 family)